MTDSRLFRCLLLVCLVVFQFHTGNMLHASGKLVPIIVKNISVQLDDEERRILQNYQELILKHICAKGDDKNEIQAQLENLMQNVKNVALLKKTKQ